MEDLIILRSVYGKVGQTYYIQPCPNPKTGKLPACVKTVDSNGDMILSEAEIQAMNSGKVHYVPADFVFQIKDGDKFDLSDLVDKANWEAIEHCNWIAKDRNERDEAGNLIIDGNSFRYGNADLYVERPGKIVEAKVNKRTLVLRASNYVQNESDAERRKKCKVLGRDMKNANPADVLEFLFEKAETKPLEIIKLYEGEEWKMRLFIIDAVERGVITRSGGVYRYGDNIIGADEAGVATTLKDIKFKRIYDAIKQQTYPNLLTKSEISEIERTLHDGNPHYETSAETETEESITPGAVKPQKGKK